MNPDPTGTDPTGTDPTGTDPTGTDPTGTDPTGTDPTGTDAPVTVTEIADFLQRLRALSRSSATTGVGAGRDATAERAVVLARKADLLARIAAQHPDLSPPAATPSAARPDGGRA